MTTEKKNDCLINGVQYNCRTCFDPGRTTYSLTEKASNAKTWREVLKDIAQLQTNDDELLPKTLCCTCLEKLKNSYDFVLQIQDVNKKYLEILTKDDGVSNDADNFTDCLAESAIALPLEQYMPEIKLEDEMVVSYDIDMSNNKLAEDDEDKFDNEDTDDPFTEIYDEDHISTSERLEENESAIAITGKSTAKRNRRKQMEKNVDLFRKTAKRTRKAKRPKETKKMSDTDEGLNSHDNDVKEQIVCGNCTRTFSTKYAYQRHQQTEHSSEETNDERNKCPICSKEFRNKFYVVDHIKVVHDKLRPFKCSHCTKCFASAGSKKIHELTHTDDFPYICEFCDKRFRLASKLKIHSEIHTTKPELLCPICKRSQRSQEELEVHLKNHDDNRLQCPSCGHLFRKRSNLNDHYNAVHLKLRPYKCEICELSFGDRKTRRVHQRSHYKKDASRTTKAKYGESTTKRNRGKKVKQSDESSPVKRAKKAKQPKKTVKPSQTDELNEMQSINEDGEAKETIVCDKCSQTFPTIHTYQRHQQAEHSSESNEEKNKCPICSKEFRNSWYVVDHIKVVHDKLKPYKCSHCPKSFASAHSKRIHELTHTNNFPYACEYCDRRFRLSSKLKIHSEIHTTKPELLCPICKRSQKSQEELEVHVKNHDDNRLQCPSCGNLFRRNAQLKDHYNAVHLKLRPYKCDFCELGFGDRKTRRVHQRTHHKQELSIASTNESLDDDGNDSDFENTSSYSLTSESYNEATSRQSVQVIEGQQVSQDGVIEKVNNNSQQVGTTVRIEEFMWNKDYLEDVMGKGLLEPPKCIIGDSYNRKIQILLFGNRLYSKPTSWRLVECKLCNSTFKTCKQLREHLKNHDDIDTLHNLKLSDSNVKYLFPNMNNLKSIKEIICRDIRKKQWFKYYTVLNEHSYEMSISDTDEDELEEENDVRANKYKCSFCTKTFSFKYQVFPHLMDAHSKEGIPFKCGRCKLEFVSIKMYMQHLQTHCHNKHKNLLCSQCPAKFVWPENVKNHSCATKRATTFPANPEDQLKSNVIDTDFVPNITVMRCALCPKSFEKLRDLRQHMPFHEDGKTGIDFENSIYIKQLESSKVINYETVQRQIQNDFRKRQISNFFQAIDKYGNEIEISDSESDSWSDNGETVVSEYKCEICTANYKRRAYLLRHQEERHKSDEMPFTCWYCDRKFVNIHLLQQHLKRECWNVKRKKGTPCEICHVRFIWRDNLAIHKKIQHHIKAESSEVEGGKNLSKDVDKSTAEQQTAKFICSFCGVSFSNNLNLTVHTEMLHLCEKIFKCRLCEMSFLKATDLQSHRLTHPGEYPHQCMFCERSFERKNHLIVHQRTHNGQSAFTCSICQKSFKKPYQLKSHFLLIHSHVKPYKCDICSKDFLHIAYLRRHQETMGHIELWLNSMNSSNPADLENDTTSKSDRILCPICGIDLSRNTSMSQHIKTHTGDRPHKCDLCERAYIRKSDLVVHRRTHTAERPFKCPHCEKAFRKRQALTKHIRVHTGERPYKCTYCHKAFSVSTRLNLHVRCHTGDKPFKCDVCGQAYTCGAYLKKHRITKGHNVGKKSI